MALPNALMVAATIIAQANGAKNGKIAPMARMIAAPITNGFRRPTLSDRGPAANPTTRETRSPMLPAMAMTDPAP